MTLYFSLMLVLAMTFPSPSQSQNDPPKTSQPQPQKILRLWDGSAPGVVGAANEEKFDTEGRVRNVTVPTISVYLPPKEKATGEAVIVCSGGGYQQLAVEKHGGGSASVFLPQGIAVIALKYRTARPGADVRTEAVADAERALRLVRYHAQEWNIDPHHIGIIGHSAGANLILNLLTKFDSGTPNAGDPVERESSRPDFAALMSAWAGGQKAVEMPFLKDAPPAFFCITEDDTTAGTTFTKESAARLEALGIKTHVAIFPTGGHQAFTIGQGKHGDWPTLFLPWLHAQLPKPQR